MLFSKILVAYDGSKASNKALDRAIELAKVSPGAVLDVIHAFDFPRVFIGEGLAPLPPSLNNDYYNLAVQTTDEAKERVQAAGVTANVDLIQGAAAEVLLDYAKRTERTSLSLVAVALVESGNLSWAASVTMWCSMLRFRYLS